jgi:hypothetical protein
MSGGVLAGYPIRLAVLRRQIEEHRSAILAGLNERNGLIVDAVEAGWEYHEVAVWSGLSTTRVGQLFQSGHPSHRTRDADRRTGAAREADDSYGQDLVRPGRSTRRGRPSRVAPRSLVAPRGRAPLRGTTA